MSQMQLILSEADIENMPPELRRSLFLHLGRIQHTEKSVEREATALGRSQVAGLLRDISFRPDGPVLRALVGRLAYAEEAEAPDHNQLAEVLPAETREDLRRHLATLSRLTPRAAKQSDARLWHFNRASRSYAVHPMTRQTLRELLPALARSGEGEEPLWEG
jgi:hypothetical protein